MAKKALDYQADKKDSDIAKETGMPNKHEHKLALQKLQKEFPKKWRKIVMRCVVHGRRRNASDRELAAEIIHELSRFLRCYVRTGVIMLPRRAFVAHLKYVEG